LNIPLSLALASSRHPREVEEILSQLRRSKSKHKRAKPKDLTWDYSWCLSGQSFTFAEVLSGAADRLWRAEDAMTVDEAVGDLVRRTGVALRASKGHWSGTALLATVPPEIVTLHRRSVAQKRADKAALDSLPREELQRQAEEALVELRKDPGFVELRVEKGSVVASLECGPEEETTGHRLNAVLANTLSSIEGVDAVLRAPLSGPHVAVYVVSREHGLVDRERLFDVVDALSGSFPTLSFNLHVRAHQGRPFPSVAPGSIVVYSK
jgi:hypothetical protein